MCWELLLVRTHTPVAHYPAAASPSTLPAQPSPHTHAHVYTRARAYFRRLQVLVDWCESIISPNPNPNPNPNPAGLGGWWECIPPLTTTLPLTLTLLPLTPHPHPSPSTSTRSWWMVGMYTSQTIRLSLDHRPRSPQAKWLPRHGWKS
jgi:hypothetical protein